MRVIRRTGRDDLATVFVAETPAGKRVEFVQSLQPPFPRSEKWVLIVSTLYGCPVGCEMCDAGGSYSGRLSAEEIFFQLDHMVDRFFPGREVTSKKFKVQFARVGEPSLNMEVLKVLRGLPERYRAAGLIPSLSTVAPEGSDDFFEELLRIKEELYPGNFQLQFSIHSTDDAQRDRIMPIKKWGLAQIADFGKRFHSGRGRKVTLNFVLAEGYRIAPWKIRELFPPENFFIKMTPLNPTGKAASSKLVPAPVKEPDTARELRHYGFDTLYSVGELEENLIGSNCGQYLKAMERAV